MQRTQREEKRDKVRKFRKALLTSGIVVLIMTLLIILTILFFPYIFGNRSFVDMTYRYSYAVIGLPDGNSVKGQVQSWTDYVDGDQLQVKIDGVTYLVHSSDCVLIAK